MPPAPQNSFAETENSFPEFTKDFFEKALQNGRKPEITSFKIKPGAKIGDNYLSLTYSVELTLNSGEEKKLFIKCFPSNKGTQDFNIKSNVFYRELKGYETWIQELITFQKKALALKKEEMVKLPFARLVHGKCIDFSSQDWKMNNRFPHLNPLDSYIILEDLKSCGFRLTNRRHPLDFCHMKLVFSALAKMHASSWAYKYHNNQSDLGERFPFLIPKFQPEDMETFEDITKANINQAKTFYDEEFGKGNEFSLAAERFKKNIPRASTFFLGEHFGEGMEGLLRCVPDVNRFGKDVEHPVPWKVLCHGDCWSNNALFRYDEQTNKPVEIVPNVDLQMVHEGCLVSDLQYVTYLCTNAELRRNHLNDLLLVYHDEFNKTCNTLKTPTLPGFNLESLKFRFHRAKLSGYYAANMGLPVSLKEDENNNVEESNSKEMDEFSEVFAKIALSGSTNSNYVLKSRLMEITKELIEDGVL